MTLQQLPELLCCSEPDLDNTLNMLSTLSFPLSLCSRPGGLGGAFRAAQAMISMAVFGRGVILPLGESHDPLVCGSAVPSCVCVLRQCAPLYVTVRSCICQCALACCCITRCRGPGGNNTAGVLGQVTVPPYSSGRVVDEAGRFGGSVSVLGQVGAALELAEQIEAGLLPDPQATRALVPSPAPSTLTGFPSLAT